MEFHPDPAPMPGPAPCPLQQHPHYARTLCAMGAEVQNIGIHDAGRQLARAQILSRGFGPLTVHWLARGPVWSAAAGTPDARAAVLHALPRSRPGRALWIVIPEMAMPGPLPFYHPILTPQSVAELDLTGSELRRRAAQHQKWRNRLARAERGPLEIHHRPLDPGRDAPLLARETAQRRTRRYRALPPAFTRLWAKADPRATRLFLACHGGQTVAFMLFLLHGRTASYHIGWTGPLGRTTGAHHLLLWRASSWLAQRGIAQLDLGAVDTENAPGLARFKIGCGARVRPLGATLARLVLRAA